jgi:hypothetical protein
MGVELITNTDQNYFEAEVATKISMIVGAGAEITGVQFSTCAVNNRISYSALIIFKRKNLT